MTSRCTATTGAAAAAAVADALPNAHLVVRRGLNHAKKLDAKAIAATLADFLTVQEPSAAGSGHECPQHTPAT